MAERFKSNLHQGAIIKMILNLYETKGRHIVWQHETNNRSFMISTQLLPHPVFRKYGVKRYAVSVNPPASCS